MPEGKPHLAQHADLGVMVMSRGSPTLFDVHPTTRRRSSVRLIEEDGKMESAGPHSVIAVKLITNANLQDHAVLCLVILQH